MIVFCWLYLLIAILVRIKLGKPVLFKQDRPGKDEQIFTLYKFRTMTNKRYENGNLLPDRDRLTKFGRFLRAFSLDELPEALNIIKGDMSLVGPRPLLVQYLPLYTVEQKKRHLVKPGLTGLAQISGRNACSWEKKFEYDIQYIDNVSIMLDFKIIFITIKKAFFKPVDISQDGEATVKEFAGTKQELVIKDSELLQEFQINNN